MRFDRIQWTDHYNISLQIGSTDKNGIYLVAYPEVKQGYNAPAK